MYEFTAQVNPKMPRTFGDALIHQSHFDYAVKVDSPLPEHGGQPPTDNDKKIGSLIAENLVENGATLQMGMRNTSSIEQTMSPAFICVTQALVTYLMLYWRHCVITRILAFTRRCSLAAW